MPAVQWLISYDGCYAGKNTKTHVAPLGCSFINKSSEYLSTHSKDGTLHQTKLFEGDHECCKASS